MQEPIQGRGRRSDVREIRIVGRGGQGADTVAKVLASSLFRRGYAVQAYPAFGVERRGAPLSAFVRFARGPIVNHTESTAPCAVLVLAPTLMDTIDVTAGLEPGGYLLVNTDQPARSFASLSRSFTVGVVDASAIARRHGLVRGSQPLVSAPMLGAFTGESGLSGLDEICALLRQV